MIKKISISNFRCFNHIEIENLSLVNIIGGRNNSGKSALLESILLPNIVLTPNYFTLLSSIRTAGNQIISSNQIWNPLFYKMGNTKDLEIFYEHENETSNLALSKRYVDYTQSSHVSLENLNKKFNENELKRHFALQMKYTSKEQNISGEYTIRNDLMNNNIINFQPNAEIIFPILSLENMYFYKQPAYIMQMPEWISQISLDNNKKNLLITILKKFDDDIIDVVTVLENTVSFVYVKFKSKEAMPINYMGDGINKALSLLLCILNLPNGILLIDEIENGLYFKLYEEILPIICEAALQNNCQIFMTTHNKNIIKTIVDSMKHLNRLDALCYQRMALSKGKRKAFAFSGEDLVSSFDSNVEMR